MSFKLLVARRGKTPDGLAYGDICFSPCSHDETCGVRKCKFSAVISEVRWSPGRSRNVQVRSSRTGQFFYKRNAKSNFVASGETLQSVPCSMWIFHTFMTADDKVSFACGRSSPRRL